MSYLDDYCRRYFAGKRKFNIRTDRALELGELLTAVMEAARRDLGREPLHISFLQHKQDGTPHFRHELYFN